MKNRVFKRQCCFGKGGEWKRDHDCRNGITVLYPFEKIRLAISLTVTKSKKDAGGREKKKVRGGRTENPWKKGKVEKRGRKGIW